MKQKIAAMMVALAAAFAASATGGTLAGSGTAASPYEIADYPDLLAFSAKVNGGEASAWAVLTQDIDASASSGGSPWTPIGNGVVIGESRSRYGGTFDGRNHAIRNLTYSNASQNYAGLVGIVNNSGVVKNVGLEGGSITGNRYVGGIAGENHGIVVNCHNKCAVNGSSSWVGGVVGLNVGTVAECYNTGNVNGLGASSIPSAQIGGVVGGNDLLDSRGTMENCYNLGTVTGTAIVGGVAGFNAGTIANCYSAGGIEETGSELHPGTQVMYVGGVLGCNKGTMSNAFFDTDKVSAFPAIGEYSLDPASGGTATNVQGLTTTQMRGASARQNMGLDPNVWKAASGYPELRGVGFVTPVSYYDPIGGTNAVRSTYIPYTGETVLEGGCWYVVTGAVTNESRIMVYEKVNLLVCDGASLVAPCGIGVLGGSTLTIWGQDGQYAVPGTSAKTRGTGALTASTGSDQAAAIGGAKSAASGDIVINGGVVTARGTWGAGIGGGDQATNLGSVTINGGFVDASGSKGSAGIGGGGYADGCNVTISGGYVIATGSAYDTSYNQIHISQAAPGIGSGRPKPSGAEPRFSGVIRILGGTVVAQAGIPNETNGRIAYPAQAIGVNGVDAGYRDNAIYPILGEMAAFSSVDAMEPVAATGRMDVCHGEWVTLTSCTHRRDARDVCIWCGTEFSAKSLKAGEYFKATLMELGHTVPLDGNTPYKVVAKGLPAGLKLMSNKAVTKKVKVKGKWKTVIVKPANVEWWIEGVPTAALDYATNPAYLVIAAGTAAPHTEALLVDIKAQEVTELDGLALGETVNRQFYLEGVTNGWTVSGLPTGLKYTAKLVTTKKMKGKKVVSVTTNALPYSVYGKTTKAGLFTITAKKKAGAFYETMKYRVLVQPRPADPALFGDSLTNITTMAYVPLNWNLETGEAVPSIPSVPFVPSATGGVKVATVTGLPAGLALKGQVIKGTPTKPGTYVVTFTKNVTTGTGKKKKTVAKTAQILWKVVANDAEVELGFNTEGGVIESGSVGLKYGDLLAFEATSNATVTASGLPAGMKLMRVDGSAGGLAPPGEAVWGFAGFTTKAGTYLVTVTATLNGKTVRQRLLMNVEGLPTWAKGTFNGSVKCKMENGELGEDVLGLATITVSSVGKISGKFYEGGTNWVLSAASYTAATSAAAPGGGVSAATSAAAPGGADAFTCSNVVAKYTYKAKEKVKGKWKTVTKSVTRTFALTVAPVPVVPDVSEVPVRGVAALVEGGGSPGGLAPPVATEIDAWQNLWGTTYKTVGKRLFYTSKKKPFKTFAYGVYTNETGGVSFIKNGVAALPGLTYLAALSLKVTPSGAVTATLSYDTGKTKKDPKTKKTVKVIYKSTCATVVIPTTAADAYQFLSGAYLFFAPSAANSFPGVGGWVQVTDHDKVQLWEGGPYWATTNIGAERPEDYGLYFWWGDTTGYHPSSSGEFDFDFSESNPAIYTYGKGESQLKSEGWVTDDGVLAPAHDAAQAHWGGSWRMPTDRELQGLVDNCVWSPATVNGVDGYIVSGKDDYDSASIFLPFSGYGNGTSLSYAGSRGYFWSSVPISDDYYDSWGLYFNSSDHGTYNDNRFFGQSVRPVQGFTE